MIRSRPDLVLGLCVFVYTLLYLPIYAGILIIFGICLLVVKKKTDWLEGGGAVVGAPNALAAASSRVKKQQQGARWRLSSGTTSTGGSSASLNHLHRIVSSTASASSSPRQTSPYQSLSPNQSPFTAGRNVSPRLAFECINYNNSHPLGSRSPRLSPKFTSTPTATCAGAGRMPSSLHTMDQRSLQGLARLRGPCLSEKSCSEGKSPFSAVCQPKYTGPGIYPVVNLSPISPTKLSPSLGGTPTTPMHYKLPHSEMLSAAKLRLGRETSGNSAPSLTNSSGIPTANTRNLKKRLNKDSSSINDANTKRQRADLPYFSEPHGAVAAPMISDGLIPYFDDQMMESASCLFSPRPISTSPDPRLVSPSGAGKTVTFKRQTCTAIESSYSSSKRMLINNMASTKRKRDDFDQNASTSKRSNHTRLPESPTTLLPNMAVSTPVRAPETVTDHDDSTARPPSASSSRLSNSPSEEEINSPATSIIQNQSSADKQRITRPFYVPTVADYMADRKTDEDRLKTILSFLSPQHKEITVETNSRTTSIGPSGLAASGLGSLSNQTPFSLLATPSTTSGLLQPTNTFPSALAMTFGSAPSANSATTSAATFALPTTTSASQPSVLCPNLMTTAATTSGSTNANATSLASNEGEGTKIIASTNTTATTNSQIPGATPTMAMPLTAQSISSSLFSSAPALTSSGGNGATIQFGLAPSTESLPKPLATTTTTFSYGGAGPNTTITSIPVAQGSSSTNNSLFSSTAATASATPFSIVQPPITTTTSAQSTFGALNFAAAFQQPPPPVISTAQLALSFGGGVAAPIPTAGGLFSGINMTSAGSAALCAATTTVASSLLPNPASQLGFNSSNLLPMNSASSKAMIGTAASAPSTFGGVQSQGGGITFGAMGAAPTAITTVSSPFANSGTGFTTAASTNLFGSANNYTNGPTNTMNAINSISSLASNSLTSTTSASTFGALNAPVTASFGMSVTSSTKGANTFGAASSQSQTTANLFGRGVATSGTFGNAGAFGGSATAPTTNAFGATNAFGGGAAAISSPFSGTTFGSGAPTTSSMGAPTPAFGSVTQANNNAGFASSTINFSNAGSAFSSATSPPSFGSSSMKMSSFGGGGAQPMNGNNSTPFVFGGAPQPATSTSGGFNFGGQTNGTASSGFQFSAGGSQPAATPGHNTVTVASGSNYSNNNNNFNAGGIQMQSPAFGVPSSGGGFAFNPASPPSFNFGAGPGGPNPATSSPAMFSMGSGAAPSSRRLNRNLAARSARHR